jgi:hypothetical protein
LARQTNANRDVSVASSQALTRAIVVDSARLCAANQDRNSQNLRIFLKSSAPAWAGPTGKEHVWGGAVRGGGLSGRFLTVRKFDEIASAIGQNDLARVHNLVSSPETVNLANGLQTTPLHYAAFCGWPAAIKILLDAGTNPSATAALSGAHSLNSHRKEPKCTHKLC